MAEQVKPGMKNLHIGENQFWYIAQNLIKETSEEKVHPPEV